MTVLVYFEQTTRPKGAQIVGTIHLDSSKTLGLHFFWVSPPKDFPKLKFKKQYCIHITDYVTICILLTSPEAHRETKAQKIQWSWLVITVPRRVPGSWCFFSHRGLCYSPVLVLLIGSSSCSLRVPAFESWFPVELFPILFPSSMLIDGLNFL